MYQVSKITTKNHTHESAANGGQMVDITRLHHNTSH